jgi:hypothetical protein
LDVFPPRVAALRTRIFRVEKEFGCGTSAGHKARVKNQNQNQKPQSKTTIKNHNQKPKSKTTIKNHNQKPQSKTKIKNQNQKPKSKT